MVGTDQTAPDERRATRRVTVRAEVIRDGKPSVSFGRGQNLSEGGMMVESSEVYSRDAVMDVRFALPSHPPVVVTAKAKVVWAQPGTSIGVEFLDLKDEFRAAIARFVGAS